MTSDNLELILTVIFFSRNQSVRATPTSYPSFSHNVNPSQCAFHCGKIYLRCENMDWELSRCIICMPFKYFQKTVRKRLGSGLRHPLCMTLVALSSNLGRHRGCERPSIAHVLPSQRNDERIKGELRPTPFASSTIIWIQTTLLDFSPPPLYKDARGK